MNYFKGVIWLVISFIVGIVNDAIMKYLGTTTITSWQVIFFRYSIATICLLPIICLTKTTSLKTTNPYLHIARGTILMVAMMLWNKGLSLVTLSTATLLSFTVPIFVLALAPLFLKEKVCWRVLIATFACFTGSIIATDSVTLSLNSSVTILILAELLFAILDILYKKHLNRDSLLTTVFYSSIIPSILTSIPALTSDLHLSLAQIMMLISLGVCSNLLLFCILKAYSFASATSLAPFRYVELLISISIGYIIFWEVPSLNMVAGGIIISGSLLLVGVYKKE